jgi:hypothetical protein
MWVMWYQLWLAERALHAATLFATRGQNEHRDLAERILAAYADRYLQYPNRDNVLGPTRVFFSTYLESIWTLQLACALHILESSGAKTLGNAVRDRVIQPSAQLILQYDEGLSNRQVWNNAALLACAQLLGDAPLAERAVAGRSGLNVHLQHALLGDGTWYEGENYHLFAHRGLWYGVTLADSAGLTIPNELRGRYRRAFEAPFLTALPDFTFPSRRDSQYKVSLRQWRIAESCELGLAESSSEVLAAALTELYSDAVSPGDTGRARSTAEAEQNVAETRLTRADLGWKSLLYATEAVATPATKARVGSVLLPDQGFAVLRRDDAHTYVALDYGESGGSHGHPDRLNLWLVAGDARVLEDVGTGSYVDPSLHWYRSSLAHNAPFANGTSQMRTDGELFAYDEQGEFGWILARADLSPNVDAERAVVVGPGYLVDELLWSGPADTVVDLPYHVTGNTRHATWIEAPIPGGQGLEDGFSAVTASSHSPPLREATIDATVAKVPVTMWIHADSPCVLWRLRAPGPPNELPRDFFLVRSSADTGRLRTVIDWSGAVANVHADDNSLTVVHTSGTRHTHTRRETDWIVRGDKVITLSGAAAVPDRYGYAAPREYAYDQIAMPVVGELPDDPGGLAHGDAEAVRFRLGAEHYRRSEQSWKEAGCPSATVAFAATRRDLHVDVIVEKAGVTFARAQAVNPLDNEHPDINSDGLQLYVGNWSWLVVPEAEPNVRLTARHKSAQPAPELRASWRLTPAGYAIRMIVPIAAVDQDGTVSADVIVNETTPDRERRRGQLVLSGAPGEWVYLRGDRQDPARFMHFALADA